MADDSVWSAKIRCVIGNEIKFEIVICMSKNDVNHIAAAGKINAFAAVLSQLVIQRQYIGY